MSRVPFGDALVDLITFAAPRPDSHLTLTDVHLDLPIEVAIAVVDGLPTLLAHPRRWRLFTAFDTEPSRLVVHAGSGHAGSGHARSGGASR